MQKLSFEELVRVNSILHADRQWRREERIKHAKRNLKLAYASKDQSEIAIRKVILRRLDYDYIDKVNERITQ